MAGTLARTRNPPDFVIPGAPRSGTTFMHEYLNQHPQIFMSAVKEPNHFATDLDSGSYMDSVTFMRDRATYLALYDAATPEQLTGEASTWYLFSEDAARNIHASNPETRIVAMLRDPVRMLHSLHLRRQYGGSEDIERFEDALAAEQDRREGRRISARARNIKAFQYRDVGRYAAQVQRYIDVFGRDRVLVVIFEEFQADPTTAYRSVLEFLGVDPDFQPEFEVVNAGMTRRSPRVQKMLLRPSVIRTARLVISNRLKPTVGQTWDRINSRGKQPAKLDPQVARSLRTDLQPDIDVLAELIGRDLNSLWPAPPPAA